MGIKLQKWPLRSVLKYRNRLRRCGATPFALADSLWPKDVRENLYCHPKYPTIFFGALWRPSADLPKRNFDGICLEFALKWPWQAENHTRGAFGGVKSDWRVVRPPRLLSRIAMTLRMSARTYNIIYSRIKFFLRSFKVEPLVSKRLIIPHFTLKMGIKLQKRPLRCVLKCRNRLRRRGATPSALLDILRS